MPDNPVIICEQCHLTVTVPKLAHRERAMCPRCGVQLTAHRRNAVEYSFAFSIAGLIFLALSLPFSFLSFSASGQFNTMDLIGGLITLSDNDYMSLAIVTGLATWCCRALCFLAYAFCNFNAYIRHQVIFPLAFLHGWSGCCPGVWLRYLLLAP